MTEAQLESEQFMDEFADLVERYPIRHCLLYFSYPDPENQQLYTDGWNELLTMTLDDRWKLLCHVLCRIAVECPDMEAKIATGMKMNQAITLLREVREEMGEIFKDIAIEKLFDPKDEDDGV